MKIFTICAVLSAVFFLASCGDIEESPHFESRLEGTWKSNDSSVYSGTLKINYKQITITGYLEDQTPLLGNDNQRPFKSFTKDIALKGYSEDGKIFIEDRGLVQEGIPYVYFIAGIEKLLSFTFGGRTETLKWQYSDDEM